MLLQPRTDRSLRLQTEGSCADLVYCSLRNKDETHSSLSHDDSLDSHGSAGDCVKKRRIYCRCTMPSWPSTPEDPGCSRNISLQQFGSAKVVCISNRCLQA